MKFSYHNPVKICFGINYESELATLGLKNIVLITSQGFSKSGVVSELQDIFGTQILQVIDTITSNPQLGFLQDLKRNLCECECIIALGGGSVLDSAKFLSLQNEVLPQNGELKIIGDRESIPIYALPTTAGTSSELTQWATIWDKNANIKYSLSHPTLYPKVALYDITLMQSLPYDLTISTALDSLSHSIESIWNNNANPISTHYALKAIEIILSDLVALCEDLDSLTLRKSIALASVYAGLAFSNTQTALAHAISYPITMRFGTPHGLACSFSIPLLLECLPEGEAKHILTPFIPRINELFARLNVSSNPKDYGLDSEFIEEIFSSLNARAKNGVFDIGSVKEFLKK